jgi:hypothetical protein
MTKGTPTAFTLQNEAARLWSRRWWILGFLTLAGAGAVLFSSPAFMPPEYRSSIEVVPPSLKYVMMTNYHKLRFDGYGIAEDEDLERLVAHLQSDSARRYIQQKFDLAKRYKVLDAGAGTSPTLSEKQAKVLDDIYGDRINPHISSYSTVAVDVYDTDPVVAAAIANEFIALADSFVEHFAQRRTGLAQVALSIDRMNAEATAIRDTLQFYRTNYQLYNIANMPEAIANRLGNFGNPAFHANYDKILTYQERGEQLEQLLAELQNEQAFRQEHLQTHPSLLKVISHGIPAGYKTRPIRWLIVLLTLVIAGAFAVTVVILAERFRIYQAGLLDDTHTPTNGQGDFGTTSGQLREPTRHEPVRPEVPVR